jgi:VIT1/CCC1 family predicted Fe2+/Mn2+ transporter
MTISRENLFAVVIGLMDGILTAVTLAAAKMTEKTAPLSLEFAFRIAAGAAVSAVCIFFVAEYARQRRELVHAEQHLSLRRHGQLAVSSLGRTAMVHAARGAGISCACSFLGAFLSLAPAAARPDKPWLALVASFIALALLGASLAHVIFGRTIVWAGTLVVIGAILAFVGVKLHIL